MYNTESEIQKAVVRHIKLKYPNVLFTIAPAGQRRGSAYQRMRAGAEAKQMGYNKGCPDIMIFEPKSHYRGLFIEIKSETGRKDPNQIRWIDALRDRGYYAEFCFGYRDAIRAIDKYFE